MIENAADWRLLLYGALILAAIHDIGAYRIPNWIPLAIIAALGLALIATGAAPADFLAAAQSALIGLGVGYGLYAGRMMGAGDGKLFAAAAAWFDPAGLLTLAFFIAMSGVGLSLSVLGGRFLRAGATNRRDVAAALKTAVPYGVAIMAGTIAASELLS